MRLGRDEITALKGLSIIMIVLHNVIHMMCPVHENEFSFSQSNVTALLENFCSMPVSSFFSFFGWLGVSFFIFASAYGLTVKYGDRPLPVIAWLRQHYLKLFLLMLPAFAAYIAMSLYRHPQGLVDFIYFAIEQSLLLNILNPYAIVPGVFWYIGIAFQFYIWYLVLRRASDKQLILMALCSCALVAFLPQHYVSYIRHNSLGWMSEFAAGILLARHPHAVLKIKRPWTMACICILAAALLSFSRYTYMIAGLCFTGALLACKELMAEAGALLRIGKISASIYIVHPVVRAVWFALSSGATGKIPPPLRDV